MRGQCYNDIIPGMGFERYLSAALAAKGKNVNNMARTAQRPGTSSQEEKTMVINYVDGKYVDEKTGLVKLDPTV